MEEQEPLETDERGLARAKTAVSTVQYPGMNLSIGGTACAWMTFVSNHGR